MIRTPAYILDRHWDAIAWNRPAALLFEDWLKGRGARNLLRYVFLHPLAPSFIVHWPERAQRLVAEYRSDTAAWREYEQFTLRVAQHPDLKLTVLVPDESA